MRVRDTKGNAARDDKQMYTVLQQASTVAVFYVVFFCLQAASWRVCV